MEDYSDILIFTMFSSQEKVNFNGTNNIDPVILSSKLKKIKNIDQILAKLIVTYISNEADFEEEIIEGKNLRAHSSIVLTPEGFCFHLHDVVTDLVPINMKFYFIKSDLYGVRIKADPRKKKIIKLNLDIHNTKNPRGALIVVIFPFFSYPFRRWLCSKLKKKK